MRSLPRTLLSIVMLAASHRALAQTVSVPEITFADPPGWYRSAIYPPADFNSNQVNAGVQVYPFQKFNGDPRPAFQRTLLKELIDPRYQETNVAGVRMDSGSMQGADYILRAQFQDVVVGPPGKPHMRIVIVVGSYVAIVEAEAATAQGWQMVVPQLNTFFASVRVGMGTQPDYTASTGAAGKALAGLYQGITQKYMTNLQLGAGYGYYKTALLFYLFSADGRVYRHYDELNVPGNDPARFNWSGAQMADPTNFGHYVINGDSVFVKIGNAQHTDTFAAQLPKDNTIMIATIAYKRK